MHVSFLWAGLVSLAVCIMYHPKSQVCFVIVPHAHIKTEFIQSSSLYHWHQPSPNRWGIKAQLSEPQNGKKSEDDSSSHKTTGYVSLCLCFQKDNTHSDVQLNLLSSWLIFFVHCVAGYKMVDRTFFHSSIKPLVKALHVPWFGRKGTHSRCMSGQLQLQMQFKKQFSIL